MGFTKFYLFNQQQNLTASIAKALGHPARVAILESILHCDTCCSDDLEKIIPLSQATISQHLSVLVISGVIRTFVRGNNRTFLINPCAIEELEKYLIFTRLTNARNSSDKAA